MVMLSKLSTKSEISGFTSTSCSIEIILKTCTFCPGIDGRKSSFTGYTSHRKSSNNGDFDKRYEADSVGNPSSYDDSSVNEVDSKRSKEDKFKEEKKEDNFDIDLSLIEKVKSKKTRSNSDTTTCIQKRNTAPKRHNKREIPQRYMKK